MIELGFTARCGAIMGFHQRSGTALLALAMVLAGAGARGAEDDASGEPALPRCHECSGWGKTDCPDCRGSRVVDGPCPVCEARGGSPARVPDVTADRSAVQRAWERDSAPS